MWGIWDLCKEEWYGPAGDESHCIAYAARNLFKMKDFVEIDVLRLLSENQFEIRARKEVNADESL